MSTAVKVLIAIAVNVAMLFVGLVILRVIARKMGGTDPVDRVATAIVPNITGGA